MAKYGWCQVNSSAVCCASAPRTSSIIVFRVQQWIALIHIYSEIVARAADPSQSFPRFQFINVLNVHSIRAFSFYLSVKKKFVSTCIERPCNSSFAIKCAFWLILIAATPATQFFQRHKAKLLWDVYFYGVSQSTLLRLLDSSNLKVLAAESDSRLLPGSQLHCWSSTHVSLLLVSFPP